MLNKEAQDLLEAEMKFEVGTGRMDMQRIQQTSSFYVTQYFDNNTTFDLTVMDNFGIRQTLPKKDQRVGEKALVVVREYRIKHGLESCVRNFFDEVSVGDGVVLEALKEAVDKPDFFSTRGFGDHYRDNALTGYMFFVTFSISQDQLYTHKSLSCMELGVVVSRKLRSVMPANPCYATNNKGSYNPFRAVVGKTFSMKRVVANSYAPLKETYWFFIADTLHEVEYVCNKNLNEGLYLFDYKKDLDESGVITNNTKFLEFNDAFNKNGFFMTQRDAMLTSNTERSLREREASLKEREHFMKVEELDFQERLNSSKRELALVKQAAEHQSSINALELEAHKQSNTKESYYLESQALNQKANTSRTEVGYKTNLLMLEHKSAVTQHYNELELEKLKLKTEIAKLNVVSLKNKYSIEEMNRSSFLSQAVLQQKLHLMEAEIVSSGFADRRKKSEEANKLVGSIFSSISSTLKLIGK